MKPRSYEVGWTGAARRDLLEIFEYILQDRPVAAAQVLDRIEQRTDALRRFPERGRFVPELHKLQIRTFRELIVPPYRLLYKIEGARVLVLAYLDARRNLEDLLLDRLLRE